MKCDEIVLKNTENSINAFFFFRKIGLIPKISTRIKTKSISQKRELTAFLSFSFSKNKTKSPHFCL